MNKALLVKYPWLKITTTVENYIEPSYYDNILKDYVFGGLTDLELFESFLNEEVTTKKAKILELGSGTGRVTDVLLANNKDFDKLTLVDLSRRMLEWDEKKYINLPKGKIEFVQSDSLEYLSNNKGKFDLIYSLWSFSHSTHQHLSRLGLKSGKTLIKNSIRKMVEMNLNKNGHFFMIHFDSRSDEQQIMMQLWKRYFPIFKNTNIQSPSKLILDDIFDELDNDREISLSREHLIGEEIVYDSINEALEIFLNFHAESFFNEDNNIAEIIRLVSKYFLKFQRKDGKIAIKPGCFIYKVKKL